MATPKQTLKNWFKNGMKPVQEQFYAWMDSFWHKDEKIPVDTIEGIDDILKNKADKEIITQIINRIEGIINDSLPSSTTNTYSIDKIRELITQVYTNVDELVQSLEYDENTGILVITHVNGDIKNINLPKENFLSDVQYNSETKEITFTLVNGTSFTVNIAELAELTLQNVTENGNTTDKDLITNDAAIGRDSNNENLKFGKEALKSIATGKHNTAIGDHALSANETSPENTAVGYKALSKLKSGDYNTAIGKNAGANIESSENSTIIGTEALPDTNNANRDTFIGSVAGKNWNGGTYQSITVPGLTRKSGRNVAIGDQAFYQTKRGYANTVIGWGTGRNFKNFGDHNTFIGYNITGLTSGTYGDLNVVIGANAPISGENKGNLIIHAQHTTEDNSPTVGYSTVPLIGGNFIDRWISFGGKIKLQDAYVPNTEKEQDQYIPTHVLTQDSNKIVGTKDISVFAEKYKHDNNPTLAELKVGDDLSGLVIQFDLNTVIDSPDYDLSIKFTNGASIKFVQQDSFWEYGIYDMPSGPLGSGLVTPTPWVQSGTYYYMLQLTEGKVTFPAGMNYIISEINGNLSSNAGFTSVKVIREDPKTETVETVYKAIKVLQDIVKATKPKTKFSLSGVLNGSTPFLTMNYIEGENTIYDSTRLVAYRQGIYQLSVGKFLVNTTTSALVINIIQYDTSGVQTGKQSCGELGNVDALIGTTLLFDMKEGDYLKISGFSVSTVTIKNYDNESYPLLFQRLAGI
jgi:hypothetical protein